MSTIKLTKNLGLLGFVTGVLVVVSHGGEAAAAAQSKT